MSLIKRSALAQYLALPLQSVTQTTYANDLGDEKTLRMLFKEKNLDHLLDEEITFI